jgi:multidrug transporter EmrE-like cation transporter
VLDHGINKVHSDALLIWKAISTIQSSIAYHVIRGQGISVSSIIVYCQIWGQEISLPLYYDAKEKDKKD